MTDFSASAHLKSLSLQQDADIDLFRTALALSSHCDGISAEKYLIHVQKLCDGVAERHQALLKRGGVDDARGRLAALKHILSDEFDYRLDAPEAEPIEAADIARVIERRKGQSSAISLLYLHTAHTQGWSMDALSFPAYMICRLEFAGERLVIDVARQCKILEAADLREMIKKTVGAKAELSAQYFEPLTKRQTLIRFHNTIKLRRIEMGEYAAALVSVNKMRLIDPGEYRLMLDAGVLYAKLNHQHEAIAALEGYLDRAPQGHERNEAAQLLREIRGV